MKSGRFRAKALGAAVLGIAVLTAACAHSPELANEGEVLPFRLGREDVVEISVYRDSDLSRTVPVRPDGKISLPIVGEIEAAGRTPEEIREEVIEKLSGYVKDPAVVTFIVREVNSARFYVVGEVGRPGSYPLHGDMSVLQALAVAGGLGEFSARKHVTLVRRATGERVRLSLSEVWTGKNSPLMRSGDTLVVP